MNSLFLLQRLNVDPSFLQQTESFGHCHAFWEAILARLANLLVKHPDTFLTGLRHEYAVSVENGLGQTIPGAEASL